MTIARILQAAFTLGVLFANCANAAQKAPEWMSIGGAPAVDLMKAGKFTEAITAAKVELANAENRVGKDHFDLLPFLETLSTALFARQEYDDAEEVCKRGIAIANKSLGSGNRRADSFVGVLYAIYVIDNRTAEAQEMFKRLPPVK